MKFYGWLGLCLIVVSEYALFRKIEPFQTWFYCFAWWSYILLADNLLFRLRGRSLLYGQRPMLWQMLPLSVFIWLLFEAYNLVLRNWAYTGVPAEIGTRWVGYWAAFATVLPGIFLTGDLFEQMLFGRRSSALASETEESTAPSSRPVARVCAGLGLGMCIAPLFWPRYFFPAIWIGPILLLDPLLERLGRRSFARQIAEGDWRRIGSLLAGGLACGILWEFWNYWAASRWVYSIPLFGDGKIFEMPILGFLGFPPFALECWLLYHILRELYRGMHSMPARAAFWLGIGLFTVLMFQAIDRHTILSFASNLSRSAPAWQFG